MIYPQILEMLKSPMVESKSGGKRKGKNSKKSSQGALFNSSHFFDSESIRQSGPSPLRDCPKITWIVIEAKNSSDLEGFFAADVPVYLCKKKSSRDESIFPSKTVQVIFAQSLTGPP